MISLFKKELWVFFSSFVGFIVIGIFLLISGLFLWIFDTEMNIPNAGFSNLDGFFALAPWVFLFLVPAITMRTISEESKTGTLELLFTHPIGDFKIIVAKYLAALVLVIVALIPTLIYYHTIYYLGDPPGNADTGAIAGAYIGLLFLASIYVAIGIFASALSNNQIISFILSMFLCYFFYAGFEHIAQLIGGTNNGLAIVNFGINEHYHSISRGIIDIRDLFYFISIAGLFIYVSSLTLSARKK